MMEAIIGNKIPRADNAMLRCTRSMVSGPCFTEHRYEFRRVNLQFVGYSLVIARQSRNMGFGLKTLALIPPHTPITQYEGVLMTKKEADDIRKGQFGKLRASHFASCHSRQYVINGYSVNSTQLRNQEGHFLFERRANGGIPLHIDDKKWKGMGGGSLCNHSDKPNAMLFQSPDGKGNDVFVLSLDNPIEPGQFITVNYGRSFLKSSKSNV
jgi:hypothetical protein